MPKFYTKTVTASVLLGAVLCLALLGYIQPKPATWLTLTLATFIAINEKLTRREKWTTRHIALLTALATLYAAILHYMN